MSLIINDVIFLRRPVLNYISPPVCEVFLSATGFPIVVSAVEHHPAPTGLTANRCSISWDPYTPGQSCTGSCQPAALCYTVYRSDAVEGPYAVIVDCTDATTLDVSPFGDGFYRVSAITLDGESDLSAPVQVACTIPAPTGVTGGDTCTLTWDAYTEFPVECYNVYRSDEETGPFVIIVECQTETSIDLEAFGTGFYKISAVTSEGESNLSEAVLATCCQDDEVDDWVSRVVANGGSVSATTAFAACQFLSTLKASGLRDKIRRLNLFAGDQYAAAIVPLIIDQGSAIDTGFFRNGSNVLVPATSADFIYQETGALGGLTPFTPKSFFDTGLFPPASADDWGLSFYNKGVGIFDSTEIGCVTFNTTNQTRIAISASDSNTYGWAGGNGATDVASAFDPNGIGLYTVSRLSDDVINLYKNGLLFASDSPAGPGLPNNSTVGVFAFINGTGNELQYSTRQSAGYAIHGGFTDAEALVYYNAWQAFQTALGRQV